MVSCISVFAQLDGKNRHGEIPRCCLLLGLRTAILHVFVIKVFANPIWGNLTQPILTCLGYCLKRISERAHKHDHCISRGDQEDGRLKAVKDGWRKVDEFKEVAQKLEPWCPE